MKEHFPLRGIVTTILSPFKEGTKEFLYDDLAAEIDLCARTGMVGCLCPSGASEISTLSEEEKINMVKVAHEAAAGRTLIIPSVNKSTPEECAKQAEEYLKAGADAINSQVPWQGNDEEYYACIEAIDRMKPSFIIIQDSGFVGGGMPVETIVGSFDRFETVRVCKIEVTDNEPKYTKVIEATENRMTVFGGAGTPNTIEGYDRGVCGYMPSGLYELFANINKLYFEKDRESAVRLFRDVLPILQFNRTGTNHLFHKVYLKKIGIFRDAVMRQDRFKFDEYHRKYIDWFVDYAIALTARIPEYWQ